MKSKALSVFKNIRFNNEIFVIAVSIATYILFNLFSTVTVLLDDFSSLYISHATIEGVDVSARVNIFYRIVFGLLIAIPLVYSLLFYLTEKVKISKKQIGFLSVVSFTGLMFIVFNVFKVESTQTIHLTYTVLLIYFIMSIVGYKYKTLRCFTNPVFGTYPIAMSGVLSVFFLFIFNSSLNVLDNLNWVYIVILLITITSIFAAKKLTGLSFKKILHYCISLTLVPVIIFLSVELAFCFKLNFNTLIPFKWIAIAFWGLLFLISVYLIVKKKISLSGNKLSRFYSLSLLFSFILLVYYFPILDQSKELFELANPANALMRIFHFQEIPFIDFMSSHMFSEQYYGIIYNLFFGYDGSIDFLIYRFFTKIIFFVIAFVFLSKIFENKFASVLFLISFPFIGVFFSPSVFIGVVMFFAINKLIEEQSVKNYLILLFLILAMIFWGIDVGFVSLMSTIIFLPLMFVVEKQKLSIKNILVSAGIFAVSILVILAVFAIIRSPQYLYDSFFSALHYLKANQAHGYSELTYYQGHQFYAFHYLLPFIAVIISLYTTFALIRKSADLIASKKYMLKASLFLFLLFIVNFQRGIVRHGFIESSDTFLASTFYIALTVFVLSFLNKTSRSFRYIVFFSIAFLAIVMIKFFPLSKGKSDLELCLTQNNISYLDTIINDQNLTSRTLGDIEFANEQYSEIKDFLDTSLDENQTFLDFSNSPMLYYYCQREVPSYFCQSLQNTIDDFLQIKSIERIDVNKVPVVVYSNYPLNWFDYTDGVPNEMRQYIIAEFIFRNYRPYGVFNNHSLWVSDELYTQLSDSVLRFDENVKKAETYDYKRSAVAINRHFALSDYSEFNYLGSCKQIGNENAYVFELDNTQTNGSPVFAKVTTDSAKNEEIMNLTITGKDALIATVLFTLDSTQNEYMVNLSNHYFWHIKQPKQIELMSDKGTKVKLVEIYQDCRYEY